MTQDSKAEFAIINGQIVLPDRTVSGQAVFVQDQKIVAVCAMADLPADVLKIDAHGAWITPGLVDMHTHGCMHKSFNDLSDESFEIILKKNLSYGTTTLLTTVMAAPLADLEECLQRSLVWKQNPKIGFASVAGVYLESPYISALQCGAISPNDLRLPSDGTIERLLNLRDAFKIFMLAPELDGALNAIRKITAAGILVSLGHTMAIEEQINVAIDAGASHVTHLWSAMSSVVRHGPWRKPGLLEVALTDDRLSAEIIADGCHLPDTLLKMAIRMKGLDALCAVSDALNGAGLPDGTHYFAGDMEYEVADGVGMVMDRSCFAGSAKMLSEDLPVLIERAGLSVPDAFRLMTATPAKLLGLDNRIGSLKADLDADIVLFDENFGVQQVIQKGTLI